MMNSYMNKMEFFDRFPFTKIFLWEKEIVED